MSNELIKKAYEKFNGVWPRGYSHLIERGSGEIIPATVMEDGSFEYVYPTKKVNTFIRGKKCTKADFEDYGNSLSNIPEGATCVSSDKVYYRKNNNNKWEFLNSYQRWQLSHSSEAWLSNLTPLQPTQWLPKVGQECEVEWEEDWKKTFIVGKDSKGCLVYETNWCEVGGYFEVAYKSTQFRPIKTDRDKFVEYALNNIVVPCNMDVLKQYLSDLYDKGARFND